MKQILQSFLILSFVIIFSSCSFKSDNPSEQDKIQGQGQHQGNDPYSKIDFELDSDGDMVKDYLEKEQGRNPFLADLPELSIKFLQNYKITGHYEGKETGQFVIDTKVSENDPNFKYRVGNLFVKENTYRVAASIGVFSTHHYGEIHPYDLTRVMYPKNDPAFFHEVSLSNRKYFDDENYKVQSISIDLENSVKLKSNGLFKNISNLKLRFYYFDYEKESYEMLEEVLVERHFNAGVMEKITITLDNVPLNLIQENYFKKGEFIVSEIADYEIPELKTTYQKLLSSVKQKAIPVVYNIPDQTQIYYVGTNGNKAHFVDLLKIIFNDNFEIKENILTKIGQFENNLEQYTYLQEIKHQDKKGKWFLLTSGMNQHYLDYEFGSEDHLVLSYITGSELAFQNEESIFSYQENISGGDNYKDYLLGNVTPNSEIHILIGPRNFWGTSKEQVVEILDEKGGSCGRNCVKRAIYCKWEINKMLDFNGPLVFRTDFKGEIDKVELVIKNEVFKLSELVEKKLVLGSWIGLKLLLEIKDISKIKEIVGYEENPLLLRIKTQVNFDSWGAKLVAVDRHWQGLWGCPFLTPQVADYFKYPVLSKESIHWNEIQYAYDHALSDEGRKHFTIKEAQNYYQRISVSVSSTIVNNFN